jgi:tetratricopeptide (TPR) repeat protein
MNYAQAASCFSKVLDLDPANDAALYELATISFADNKPEDAERLIRKAVTVSPENEWYWVLLSDIYKRVPIKSMIWFLYWRSYPEYHQRMRHITMTGQMPY